MATKDQVIGGVAFFALLIGVAILAIEFFMPGGNTKESAKASACLSNQKQLAYALILYASAHDDTLPYRDGWLDAALAMRNESDRPWLDPWYAACPGIDRDVDDQGARVQPMLVGYSFNSRLDRAKTSAIENPDNTVLTFESINLARNASDPLTSFPAEPRHQRGSPASFVDGHAKLFKPGQRPAP